MIFHVKLLFGLLFSFTRFLCQQIKTLYKHLSTQVSPISYMLITNLFEQRLTEFDKQKTRQIHL